MELTLENTKMKILSRPSGWQLVRLLNVLFREYLYRHLTRTRPLNLNTVFVEFLTNKVILKYIYPRQLLLCEKFLQFFLSFQYVFPFNWLWTSNDMMK